ncbi:MAG: tRNA (guanine(10)-N(2))-dimethyltransferase [Candidatus Aenigmarchaeota archaeon]|nr:tRNA (guanine(10)-N(2))-dimethyltransferase [Candidatus Aenigmarchaeota archaeon]
MKSKKIQEGKINFFAPKGRIYDAPVFYNPEAELTRDISISAIQAFQKQFKNKITICDALAGTGIRGLRYAKEVSGIKKVILNDKNPKAVNLIRKNIKENKLSRKCIPSNEDANILLRNNVFVVIDLDPFGSPNIFMDSASRSIYHKGFLCVTATDQSALAGTYPKSCLRKYGIKSIKTEFYNELGVRILISFIILNLARYDRAFIPLLSFSTKHYYRVFGRIEHAGKIAGLLKDFGYVNYCPKCLERNIGNIEKTDSKKHVFENCGLIYLGKILDKKFCKKVLADIRKRYFRLKKGEEKLLKMLIEEAEMSAFYYDLHSLAKKVKTNIPKMEVLIKKLKKKGFKASRTHFCLTAIKTDANYKKFCRLIS